MCNHMNQDSISFDLGCNFDYKLFDFVDQYDKKHAITSFFGKLKRDGLPGGRTASIIPDFTLDQLADYVNECKKRDITFNYLINPLSMDQNEIDPVVPPCSSSRSSSSRHATAAARAAASASSTACSCLTPARAASAISTPAKSRRKRRRSKTA